MARILLAHDQQLLREGLRLLLEEQGHHVVAEAGSDRHTVELARVQQPDVAIIDRFLPSTDGIACANALRGIDRSPPVILVSPHALSGDVIKALRVGVRGYVTDAEATAELVKAIRSVQSGTIHLSPYVVRAVGRRLIRV